MTVDPGSDPAPAQPTAILNVADAGSVGGDLDLSDNPDAGVVDVGNGQVGGDLIITDDGTAVVNANDTLTVNTSAISAIVPAEMWPSPQLIVAV